MKHIIKTLSILFIFSVLFTSCSKDGKLRKNLSGTWKLTSAKDSSGVTVDLTGINATYLFGDCKKKDQSCDGSYNIKVPAFSLDETFAYKWSIDKEVLTITYINSNTYQQNGSWNIVFNTDTQVTATNKANANEVYVISKI